MPWIGSFHETCVQPIFPNLLNIPNIKIGTEKRFQFSQAAIPGLGVAAASSSHLHRATAYEFLVSTTIFLSRDSAV